MAQPSNPYSHFLGNHDPLEVMASTPDRIERLTSLTGAKAQQSYAPGKWTAAQILSHLADCEIAFGFRLRQVMAEDQHVIQPFNQDRWAEHAPTPDAVQALSVFRALRGWNLAFIKQQSADARSKPASHPERGPLTFGSIVELIGGHDLNHLAQLETIAGQD